jgi:NAD-dependent deacetylase
VAEARTLELNLESSLVASAFQEARVGKATDLVPAFVSELLGE